MVNENTIVVVGNVVDEPVRGTTRSGDPFTSFRVASTQRRYNVAKGGYEDSHTNFYRVSAFRALAVNVHRSVAKGQPVVVTGRLRVTKFLRADNTTGTGVDIDASAIGHDLNRGTTAFTKVNGMVVVDDNDRLNDPAVRAVLEGERDLPEMGPTDLDEVDVVDPVTGEVATRPEPRDDDRARSLLAG